MKSGRIVALRCAHHGPTLPDGRMFPNRSGRLRPVRVGLTGDDLSGETTIFRSFPEGWFARRVIHQQKGDLQRLRVELERRHVLVVRGGCGVKLGVLEVSSHFLGRGWGEVFG